MVLDAETQAATSAGALLAKEFVRRTQDGDQDWVARLGQRDWAVVWFHLPPLELRNALSKLPASFYQKHWVAALLYRFLGGKIAGPSGGASSGLDDSSLADLGAISASKKFLAGLGLRLQGRISDAYQVTLEAMDTRAPIELTLLDTSSGVIPLLDLHAGITMMLYGDIARADALFQRVGPVNDPDLAFIARDAQVKAALLHSVFGDACYARACLDRAATIPRTESWAEIGIDREAALAERYLGGADSLDLGSDSLSVWRDYGEMWVFGIWVQLRDSLLVGDLDGLERQLDVIEEMNLPGAGGGGLPGAILPIMRTCLRLAQGRVNDAAEEIDKATTDSPQAQILRARVELALGDWQAATRRVSRIVTDNPGFTRLQLDAEALQAAGLVAGQRPGALEAVLRVSEYLKQLPQFTCHLLPAELALFADEHAEEYPELEVLAQKAGRVFGVGRSVLLTEREVQILRGLESGWSNAQIAAELFVSVNTVKTHTRSLYKKLDVTNRQDAVAAAHENGY